MNGMMKGLPTPQNPFGNMMNVMKQVRALQQNPNGIQDFLQKSGRLNQEQMKAINGMKNPAEIGQYLMGSVPQNMYGAIQNDVMNVHNQMK